MFHKRLEIGKERMLDGLFQKVSCVDLCSNFWWKSVPSAWYCEINGSISARGNARHRIVGLRRGIARHRLKRVAKRLPPAGSHTDIQCRNRRRHNNLSNRQRRREDTANDPNS
jgi:hypothetical protein